MKIRIRYRDNRTALKQGTARWFNISMTLLAMAAVALLSALLTVRIAVHAGEVEVPDVGGLTLDEASEKTQDAKMALTVENRFYSTTVPAGRVLSQSPVAGTTVRKGWTMRITESMGPQQASIPDTIGMDQRDAAAAIRRSSMELGTVAHLAAPGPADVVLAQTPPPNAEGVDKPEVSLLVSEPFANSGRAWVMPNLVGISYPVAKARMREMDLPLYAIVPQSAPPTSTEAPTVGVSASAPMVAGGAPDVAAPVAPVVPAGPIAAQSPAAGARVTAADSPHVTMTRGYAAAPDAASPATQAAAPVVRVAPPAPHP